MKEQDLPEWTKVCDCAGCGALLLGVAEEAFRGYPPRVAGRWRGRPYCAPCMLVYSPADAARRILACSGTL